MKLRIAALALLSLCPAVSAMAQERVAQNPDRAVLERRLRERAAQITRQRLGLNDTQMQQLQRVNSRFAPQLTEVVRQERETRRQLRQEVAAGAQADQSRVSALIDASLRLQKQRIALIEAEQQELAVFLTPVQRARYLALQAQFRNRAEQLARQNSGGRARGGRRRPPPAGPTGR
ncbi:MAG TPA: Spy/CpxP family protein refolding chaperone [Gemmatimonadaceae bacterium]|nr:Spy/CpxP family protein refolding chaperone [Gemmatimonadaceae bacterium]